jgi:hypothetical protein
VPIYPGIYQAMATKVNDLGVEVMIPQVFGEAPITVQRFIHGPPTKVGLGWVMFVAGNPEFPVWASGVNALIQSGDSPVLPAVNEVLIGPTAPADPDTELWVDSDDAKTYARIGGTWVQIVGVQPVIPDPPVVNEVWIGTDDPIAANPGIELWFDTDAPTPAATVPGLWQAWVPTMNQGAAVVLNVVGARYTRIGNTVIGDFHLVVISGGTGGQTITISRPVPGRALTGTITSVGTAYVSVAGVGQMMLHVVDPGSTGGSFAFIRSDIANVANYFGPDPSITLAAGNAFHGSFTYEAA